MVSSDKENVQPLGYDHLASATWSIAKVTEGCSLEARSRFGDQSMIQPDGALRAPLDATSTATAHLQAGPLIVDLTPREDAIAGYAKIQRRSHGKPPLGLVPERCEETSSDDEEVDSHIGLEYAALDAPRSGSTASRGHQVKTEVALPPLPLWQLQMPSPSLTLEHELNMTPRDFLPVGDGSESQARDRPSFGLVAPEHYQALQCSAEEDGSLIGFEYSALDDSALDIAPSQGELLCRTASTPRALGPRSVAVECLIEQQCPPSASASSSKGAVAECTERKTQCPAPSDPVAILVGTSFVAGLAGPEENVWPLAEGRRLDSAGSSEIPRVEHGNRRAVMSPLGELTRSLDPASLAAPRDARRAAAKSDAKICQHCGKRMGFFKGMRGFGFRERGHEARCHARMLRMQEQMFQRWGATTVFSTVASSVAFDEAHPSILASCHDSFGRLGDERGESADLNVSGASRCQRQSKVAAGAMSAAVGTVAGERAGGLVGTAPAVLFTMGVSIPVCSFVGGVAGLLTGAVCGAGTGLVAGSSAGYARARSVGAGRASSRKTRGGEALDGSISRSLSHEALRKRATSW